MRNRSGFRGFSLSNPAILLGQTDRPESSSAGGVMDVALGVFTSYMYVSQIVITSDVVGE
jgi:hypothetical protein